MECLGFDNSLMVPTRSSLGPFIALRAAITQRFGPFCTCPEEGVMQLESLGAVDRVIVPSSSICGVRSPLGAKGTGRCWH